jgi:hypothetical protein
VRAGATGLPFPSPPDSTERRPGACKLAAHRERRGAARPVAQVVNIYRHPVKGLSAEAMTRAELEAEKPFPYDVCLRLPASRRRSTPSIRNGRRNDLFAMLMLDQGLARVTTELDVDDLGLAVRRNGRVAISGRLDIENHRKALEAFFWTLPPNFPAPQSSCCRAAGISWTSRTM